MDDRLIELLARLIGGEDVPKLSASEKHDLVDSVHEALDPKVYLENLREKILESKDEVFSVAYISENPDGDQNLHVESIIAETVHEAVGLGILEFGGNNIFAEGETIKMVRFAVKEKEDIFEMIKAAAE